MIFSGYEPTSEVAESYGQCSVMIWMGGRAGGLGGRSKRKGYMYTLADSIC